jgi:hypothetical protein
VLTSKVKAIFNKERIMKIYIKLIIMLSTFLIISACDFVTSRSVSPSSPTQENVKPTQISDEVAIREALADRLGAKVDDLTIVIDQNTDTHAKGGVDNGFFLAAKVNGEWQIVADGQAMPDCQVLDQYRFPPSMVPECSDSNTPSDEESIRTALADHLEKNINDLTVLIEQNTDTHARGSVDNGIFLVAKVNGEWQIVADGQAMPDCQVVGQYRFPPSMVPECSDSNTPSDEESIRTALAAHLGVNMKDLTAVINQYTGTHARGGVENGFFLAAKVNGEWQIVADGQAMPDCQVAARYGFPPSMMPECRDLNINEDICFKPGGTFTFVQNSIGVGEQPTYKLHAEADKTMIVSVASSQKDVFMGIKGIQGGQTLLSTDAQTAYWTGIIPQTQDYAITLVTDNADTDYFMGVEIPANIRFAPGSNSTVVDGHIEVFEPTLSESLDNHVTYLLYVSEGQTLDVQLSSPNLEALSIGVYGQKDGQPYQRYQVKNSGFSGVLPITQGYYLKVFSNGVSTDFTLKITID